MLPHSKLLYAKGIRMKFTPILLIVFLSSCSSSTFKEEFTEKTMGAVTSAVTGADVSYRENQCPRVKRNCGVNGDYQEWYQENGKLACACNK